MCHNDSISLYFQITSLKYNEMYDPNHEFNISDTDTDTYYKSSCENTNILKSFLFATYYVIR